MSCAHASADGSVGVYLTPAEAAQHLQVSRWTLYKWASEGKVPVIKLGKLLRFERAALDRWLRAKATPGV